MTTNFLQRIMLVFPSCFDNTRSEEPVELGENHSDTSDDTGIHSFESDSSGSSCDAVVEDKQETDNCCPDDFPPANARKTKRVNSNNLSNNPRGKEIDSGESDNVAVEDTHYNVDIDEAYECVQVRADNPADKEAMALVNVSRYFALILPYIAFLDALYMQSSQVVRDAITIVIKDLLARYPILFGAVVCSMKKDNFQLGKMVKDRDAQISYKEQNIISLKSMLQSALSNKDPGTEANIAKELSELKKDRNLAITQLHTSRTENARQEQYIRGLQASQNTLLNRTESRQNVIDGLQCQDNEQ